MCRVADAPERGAHTMNVTSELAEAFRIALESQPLDVVSLVDKVLLLCHERGLRL